MKALLGLAGTLVAAAIVLAGPAVWYIDRHTVAIHMHVGLIKWDWRPFGVAMGERYAAIIQADAQAATDAEKRNARIAAASAKQNAELVANLRAELASTEARTRALSKRVPTYVSARADAACVVPVGFLLIHTAAVEGRPIPDVSGTAGGPLDAPSGVALSTVADTDIYNAGQFYDALAEVKTWRAWYVEKKTLWDSQPSLVVGGSIR